MRDPDDEDEDEEIWQYAPPPGDYEAERAAFEAHQAANEERRREREAFMVKFGEDPGGNDVAYRRALRKSFKGFGLREIRAMFDQDPEEGPREVIDPETRIDDPHEP